VTSSDSVSKIAESAYEDAGHYMRIFNASTDILKDPHVIQPGQELVIPNQ